MLVGQSWDLSCPRPSTAISAMCGRRDGDWVTSLDEVAIYLPEKQYAIEDLAQRLNLDSRQLKLFRRFHGLDQVRLDPDGSLLDLMRSAVGALTELEGRKDKVRYVLHARTMPVVAPFPVNPLHDLCGEFGLEHAIAFAVTHHACAASLLAIDVAGRLLAADDDPEALVLIVAAEKAFTADAQVIPETSVCGEGAAAALVRGNGARDRMLSYVTRQRGDFDALMYAQPDLHAQFQREYPVLFADVICQAIDRAGVTLDDIVMILPHNVNVVSWQRLCRKLGFPLGKVLLENVAAVGHSFGADAFINYHTARARDALAEGDHYLMAAVGAGATFSAMVFEH